MREKFTTLVAQTLGDRRFCKLVCSKPTDPTVLRAVVTRFAAADGTERLQTETFLRDGKAVHQNQTPDAFLASLPALLGTAYKQANLVTTGGEASYMVSKKGKETVLSHLKDAPPAELASHDGTKHTILQAGAVYPFLVRLGVSDAAGRIFDKKRAKFRQINRFLEEIKTILPHLPQSGELCVHDLCCGKSYLSFAAYWFLTEVCERTVAFYGVDRKTDVIDDCQTIARDLGFDGLHFLAGDINNYTPPASPHLVISLHACDIATDMVLASAVRWETPVILSSPCCHHEMMGQLDAPSLAFITRHSMLKQKLCDAATDALRALRLEAAGYEVVAKEFIDPEETPKNLLFRCVRTRTSDAVRAAKLAEYDAACKLLGVSPYLAKLLEN